LEGGQATCGSTISLELGATCTYYLRLAKIKYNNITKSSPANSFPLPIGGSRWQATKRQVFYFGAQRCGGLSNEGPFGLGSLYSPFHLIPLGHWDLAIGGSSLFDGCVRVLIKDGRWDGRGRDGMKGSKAGAWTRVVR